jgi:hypothetical protein
MRLDTWDLVRARVRRRMNPMRDEPRRVIVLWRSDEDEHDCPQPVGLFPTTGLVGAAVRVAAPVCSELVLNTHDALVHNALVPAGALSVVGGQYVLSSVEDLACLNAARLDALVPFMAAEARRLRQRVHDERRVSTLDWYVD